MDNQQPKKKKKWWVWVIIVVVVAAALANAFGDKKDKDKDTKKADSKTEQAEAAEDKKAEKETEKTEEEKDFFTIGETAEQKGISITLISAEENSGSKLNKPDDDKIFIMPLFEIENNSDKDVSISSVISVDAYVDGYTANNSLKAELESDVSTLNGKIIPGKKLKGTYGLEVPKDWEEIEISIELSLRQEAITFKITK